MITWLLITILVYPDHSIESYVRDTPAGMTHRQCVELGRDAVVGDGDNEYAVCAAVR